MNGVRGTFSLCKCDTNEPNTFLLRGTESPKKENEKEKRKEERCKKVNASKKNFAELVSVTRYTTKVVRIRGGREKRGVVKRKKEKRKQMDQKKMQAC